MFHHTWIITVYYGMELVAAGLLYPRDTETRETKSLDGLWHFRADTSSNRQRGFEEKWYDQPLTHTGETMAMPVPSSFNDITTHKYLRDFIGWVWYDRFVFVHHHWSDRRVVLRVDSAHYYAVVWVNGNEVTRHEGGHLPFQATVTKSLKYGRDNLITIAVNTTLNATTIPPVRIMYMNDSSRYPENYFKVEQKYDFFHYCGIHRSVRLYTTPHVYVDDITIHTDLECAANTSTGYVRYHIVVGDDDVAAAADKVNVHVDLEDRSGRVVAKGSGLNGLLTVINAHFWWPYTMTTGIPAYLYVLKIKVSDGQSETDVYRLNVGIRSVKVTYRQLLINCLPFYCHGINKHEDSDVRGRGLDLAYIVKDFNMMKWLGVNCFRTSHYPYSEEMMDQADRQGVVVIDESPAINLAREENFVPKSLSQLMSVMTELVTRDKNRPAVIMWSVANEPVTSKQGAFQYFKAVIDHTHKLDRSRPVTFANAGRKLSSKHPFGYPASLCDVVSVNRYFAWYTDAGHTEIIRLQMTTDFRKWFRKFSKPILASEFGVGTIAGMHSVPSTTWTEDYQLDFIGEYHKAFDDLRESGFLVGEMYWNFADYRTKETPRRANGNKKGILTRQRDPKRAAFLIRERYHHLINATLKTYETITN